MTRYLTLLSSCISDYEQHWKWQERVGSTSGLLWCAEIDTELRYLYQNLLAITMRHRSDNNLIFAGLVVCNPTAPIDRSAYVINFKVQVIQISSHSTSTIGLLHLMSRPLIEGGHWKRHRSCLYAFFQLLFSFSFSVVYTIATHLMDLKHMELQITEDFL